MDGTRRHEYQPILAAVDRGTVGLNAALAGHALRLSNHPLPALIEHQVPLHIGGISEGVRSLRRPGTSAGEAPPPHTSERH
ncbi:hypothetical protein BMW22_30535 (plasmid) [Rhizobium leguminosarum]|uniref:Uncharacterized protein n=1 Tax=Rhizobium leguminosarum TaxID=384 RepID=A0A1L3ZJK8_RHILE|nr:hypothetical protein BMW22_30535 [Rhizobium leguminosarum]